MVSFSRVQNWDSTGVAPESTDSSHNHHKDNYVGKCGYCRFTGERWTNLTLTSCLIRPFPLIIVVSIDLIAIHSPQTSISFFILIFIFISLLSLSLCDSVMVCPLWFLRCFTCITFIVRRLPQKYNVRPWDLLYVYTIFIPNYIKLPRDREVSRGLSRDGYQRGFTIFFYSSRFLLFILFSPSTRWSCSLTGVIVSNKRNRSTVYYLRGIFKRVATCMVRSCGLRGFNWRER